MGTVKRAKELTRLTEGTGTTADLRVVIDPKTTFGVERFPKRLLDEIGAERERLFKEHGLFPDTEERTGSGSGPGPGSGRPAAPFLLFSAMCAWGFWSCGLWVKQAGCTTFE